MALIIPEIYSQIVREKFLGKVKVANLATPLGELLNTTVGDTVIFPKFKTITDANEVVKGTQSPIDSLDQDSSQATIKMIDKIIRCYDIDNITAIGSQIEEASTQQAIVFARKLDSDLITEAKTTPLKTATGAAKAITANELNSGLQNYGDDSDVEDIAGIVVNSLLDASFYAMDEFVDVNKTYTTSGNGIVSNGQIGYFRGIPVFHSDKDTYDSTTNEAISFIIKKGALGYMEKRTINIQQEREEKLHATDIVGSYIYAAKLLMDDGVVMIRKTIA